VLQKIVMMEGLGSLQGECGDPIFMLINSSGVHVCSFNERESSKFNFPVNRKLKLGIP